LYAQICTCTQGFWEHEFLGAGNFKLGLANRLGHPISRHKIGNNIFGIFAS